MAPCNWRIAVYALLDPVYWLMRSAAAYQLVFDPRTWEKTPHGLIRNHEVARKRPGTRAG